MRGKGIQSVSCSEGCSAAIASSGLLYTWGSNTAGQVGGGKGKDSHHRPLWRPAVHMGVKYGGTGRLGCPPEGPLGPTLSLCFPYP